MPGVNQILSMRQRRHAAEKRRPGSTLGLGCSLLLNLGFVLGILFLAFVYAGMTRDLPPVQALPGLLEPPDGLLLQPTRLYDRSGEHIIASLENPAAAGRKYLRLAALEPTTSIEDLLPGTLVTATLAASDPYFWLHPGFSLSGIRQGMHPTLAQRLASDLLLAEETPSLRRALRERLLAAQITSVYGREKVLEWYLNSANYGRLAYGADAAARLYFGRPAASLTLGEAAMLVAAAENPGLNPLDAPGAALENQKRAIQKLLRYRLVEPQAGLQAAREEIVLRSDQQPGRAFDLNASPDNLAPAFTRLALAQLQTQMPLARLERGGLRILTSLDYDLQVQTACAAAAQLRRLSAAANPPANALVQGECKAERLLPTLPDGTSLITSSLRADVVILNPQSGEVLTLVTQPPTALDILASLDHPAGSLSLPFIYLTAFTRGLSPASLVWDIPAEREAGSQVQNFDGQYHGPMRLRIALANEYLTPAQNTLEQVGVENAWRIASQLNLLDSQAATPSSDATVLDVFGNVDLLAASQAFGILANQGLLVGRPTPNAEASGRASLAHPAPLASISVLSVVDLRGSSLLSWDPPQVRPILTSPLAYLLTHTLSDETARWPSLGHPNPLEIGRPAAAHLSRSAAGDSYWAAGYTPQRAIVVWMGAVDSQAILPPTGAAGLWHAVMQYASRDLPPETWSPPAGINAIRVCDPSGMLPTPDCPNIVEEIFISGSDPVQSDTLYQAVQINHQTGRLATVFTPADLIEKRVFFIAPPEAQSWSQNTGHEAPPQTYDTIPIQLPQWPEAAITSPAMFAVVRGQVAISGIASGDDFDFFRLQAGQGLNPQRWLQIGADVKAPISQQGQLGMWDTRGLNGLYAIQLLVVQKDQSLRRATTLVTVDNLPPEVQIIFPSGGIEITASQRRVILQAQVTDDLGLSSVEFYLDGRLLNQFTQAPFAASWEVKPGQHTLRVTAIDQAGNTSEAAVEFAVK